MLPKTLLLNTVLLSAALQCACAARAEPEVQEPPSPRAVSASPGRSAPHADPPSLTEQDAPPPARPLTPADALYVVPEVAGRIVPVPDANGDGFGDLVIARGPERGKVVAIDLRSAKDGAWIRQLHVCSQLVGNELASWDAGGDVDGDRVPDLLLGFPDDHAGAGRVLAVSGADATVLLDLRGAASDERFGTSLGFVGDVDRDGRDEFAVGAIQADPRATLFDRKVISTRSTSVGSVQTQHLQFEDGTWIEKDAYLQDRLEARSPDPGFVSLRSGRDGAELWRAPGAGAGHGFGRSLQPVGDLDADGATDLVVLRDARSVLPPTLLSGASGSEIARLYGQRNDPFGGVGDVDHDGVPDLFADTLDSDGYAKLGHARILSGRTRTELYRLPYPDWWTEYETTVGVGDLDGDGHADVALGDGNFNLLGGELPGPTTDHPVDLSQLTLDEAVQLESQPWCSFTWESGCAIIYSGRTRKPIWGVFAQPGSRRGLGLEVARLPDVNGDGAPDLIVADGSKAYAFAGPGPSGAAAGPKPR